MLSNKNILFRHHNISVHKKYNEEEIETKQVSEA